MTTGGTVPLSELIKAAQQGGGPTATTQKPAKGGTVPLSELIKQAGGTPSGTTSTRAAATAGAKKPGILGRLTKDLREGGAGILHIPGAVLTDRQTFLETALGKTGAHVLNTLTLPLPGAAGALERKSNAGIVRQPGESLSGFTARKYPIAGGAFVQGPVNLFEHAAHPTQLARDYSAHPVLGPLGDLATLAMFTGPAAAAAKAGAEGAAEGAATASAAGDAAQAAKMANRAATLGKVAKVTEGAHGAVEAGASGGLRPLLNGAGPLPGLREIPKRAFDAVQAGSNDPVTRLAARLSPQSHAVSATILGGQAEEKVAQSGQQRLGITLAKILPDRDEQAAAVAVGEKVGPALAALRTHMTPEEFAAHVEQRYKGSLSVKAANLAADITEGKAPELAAKAEEFLKTYHDAAGGQADRTAAFLAKPGNAYQAGYEPNPVAVKAAVDEAKAGLPRLTKVADQARARADTAQSAADRASAASVPPGAVDARAQRLVDAFGKVEAARARAAGKGAAVATAEDALVTKAEGSVPTLDQAHADLVKQVADERRALRTQYVDTAGRSAGAARGDMAAFFTEGPLQRFTLANQPDWYRNLPDRVRTALHDGLSLTHSVKEVGGVGPDEFIQAVRRQLPHMEGLTENQIADHFTQLYDRYAQMRKARFQPFAGITPNHLRNVGIDDPYLEALLGDAPAHEVAQHLADTYGGPQPHTEASLAALRNDALAGAGTKLVAAQQAAEDAYAAAKAARSSVLTTEGAPKMSDARAQLVADVTAKHGADAAKVAAQRFTALAMGDKIPVAEAKVPLARRRLTAPIAAAGEQAGRTAMRAKVLGNLADSAEARVGKIKTTAARAEVTATGALTNAPSRLRPVLGENRAAAHQLVGIMNDLNRRGLGDAAKAVEDTLAKLPTDLKGLETAGVDAPHFFHTSEVRPGKGGGPAGINLPKPFIAGSEKLRTGSPVFDRSVAGQVKGGTEAVKAEVRRATVERIGTLPGITARLGEGPLAAVHNVDEARAAGWVPWNPGTLFDTAGRVRPLSDLELRLGITGTTRFLPKPLFDEFRNYFEPRRGQLLGAAMDPLNRVSVLSKLALSPAFIVGRIFGHGMLALSGTSDPIAFAGNLVDVVRQYHASGVRGERSFEEISPPRLLKSNATTAEYSRLVGDTAKAEGATKLGRLSGAVQDTPVGRASGKLTELGNRVIAKPFKLASFFDDMQRTAFYMTEKGRLGDEGALEATLRATGEYDRMTPFERDYVRRVVPFWAWHRELTRIAFHLAEDHPLRVAWTLHLANLASKPDTTLPERFSQGVKAGGSVADITYLNPFNEVGSTFGGGALGVGKIAGPGAKLVYSNALAPGRNAATGRDYTRPAAFGRPPKSPSLLRQLVQPLPQKRLLDSLTGADRVKRYDSGQPRLGPGGRPLPAPGMSPLGALSNFAGVPVAKVTDQQKAQAAAAKAKAKAEKNAAKQQKNYQGKLKRLGG